MSISASPTINTTTNKQNTTSILLPLTVGTFMSALDTTVVNMALPIIQSHFHVSISIVEWVVIAYLLILSSMLLTFGRLSDLYGHKKVYLTGFVIFTICSLLCGLSTGIWTLVGFRVLQAVGASMMFSTSSAIISGNIPAEKRGKSFGIIAITVAASCCVGPILGGFLTEAFGWESIFFINVPIGVIGSLLVYKNIPTDKKITAVPFDTAGSILIFASLFLILLPIDLAGSNRISSLQFCIMLIAGIILALLFILHEKNSKHPLLKLQLFKNRVFSASLAAAVFNYMAQFMMVFLAPYYLEKIRVFSPTMAGLLYMPMPLATILIAPISGSFSDHHDSRILTSGGMGIMAAAMFMLSFLNLNTPNWFVIISMILAGIGSGMFQAPNNNSIMGNAPAEHRGAASGALATMRNIGMVLGIAISSSLFTLCSNNKAAIYAAKGLVGIHIKQQSYIYGVHISFIAAAIAGLIAMFASLCKTK